MQILSPLQGYILCLGPIVIATMASTDGELFISISPITLNKLREALHHDMCSVSKAMTKRLHSNLPNI